MTLDSQTRVRTTLQRAGTALAWLGFGLGLLAFLVAIERQNWFHVKPATGSARAMSLASDQQQQGQKRDAFGRIRT